MFRPSMCSGEVVLYLEGLFFCYNFKPAVWVGTVRGGGDPSSV